MNEDDLKPPWEDRRVRRRLGHLETDATWIYTATNSMFRFLGGTWQCSQGLYYGEVKHWFGWSSEPSASLNDYEIFVEVLDGDRVHERAFAAVLDEAKDAERLKWEQRNGIARASFVQDPSA